MDVLAGAGEAILDDKMEDICGFQNNLQKPEATVSALNCLNLNEIREK